jgi:hypothetical protein
MDRLNHYQLLAVEAAAERLAEPSVLTVMQTSSGLAILEDGRVVETHPYRDNWGQGR